MSKKKIEDKLRKIMDPCKYKKLQDKLEKLNDQASDPSEGSVGSHEGVTDSDADAPNRGSGSSGNSEPVPTTPPAPPIPTAPDAPPIPDEGDYEPISAEEFEEIQKLLEQAENTSDPKLRRVLIAKANALLEAITRRGRGGGNRDGGGDTDSSNVVDDVDQTLIDNGDGTVTHQETGLVWLKNADQYGPVTWDQARALAAKLGAGTGDLDDGSQPGDWRLPTIKELFSIIDYDRNTPLVDTDMFPNVKSAIYWTSTSLLADPTQSWMMTTAIGPTVFMLKNTKHFFWPVRKKESDISLVPKTGQTQVFGYDTLGQDGLDGNRFGSEHPSPRFVDNQDGTVKDTLTGLIWLQHADLFGWKTWTQAMEACQSLAAGDHVTPLGDTFSLQDGSSAGQWRLPTCREAESLVDYGRVGPCLPDAAVRGPQAAFQSVRPSSYWTSTTMTAAPTQAYFIIYGVGPTIFENKEHPFFVWPVRDES